MKIQKTNLVRQSFFGLFLIILAFLPSQLNSQEPVVVLVQLNDDTINPVTAQYVESAIDQAELMRAQCVIIKLDTPGGLLNSTRAMVKKIMASSVPVVTYIAPSGSRAGSAGVFITYASHIAAMAPSTNIGAAHPVQLGREEKRKDLWQDLQELSKGLKEKPDLESSPLPPPEKKIKTRSLDPAQQPNEDKTDSQILSDKILNDTVAFIKALAMQRKRNAEWAVKSVTESASITDSEALEKGVIDLIADDTRDLLTKIDGKTVSLNNRKVTLSTQNAAIHDIPMTPRQQFFNVLANPNIAYILLILGFYGLLYEITHPGLGAPGVLGTIFLILAFFSMQTLPTNYAGLALVILGLILFVAEALTPGFGFLALGGTASMILGSLLLFDTSVSMMKVSLSLILTFTLTTAGITLFLLRAVLRVHSRKTMSGPEAMVGETAEVQSPITPSTQGKVYVHGELWNAVSDQALAKGDKVKVVDIEGMTLKVKKFSS